MKNLYRIEFVKVGQDSFIDFLKAYSIFCVVVSHCLPIVYWDKVLFHFWGDMQVPMFLLIQTFHAYKKGTQPRIKYKKVFTRIVAPFLAVQLILIGIFGFVFDQNFHELMCSALSFQLKGPGSYYVLIYLQFVFLLAFLYPIVEKMSEQNFLFLMLALSIGAEVLFSVIQLPDSIYRLLFVRYLFLVYLGLIWVRRGVEINLVTIGLSLFSIAATLFFVRTNLDLEPIFFNTGWKFHRWICYFNVAWLLPFVLYKIYLMISKVSWLNSCVMEIGKCSYEIFLVQMLVFGVFYQIQNQLIESAYYNLPLMMIATTSISILGEIVFKRIILDRIA